MDFCSSSTWKKHGGPERKKSAIFLSTPNPFNTGGDVLHIDMWPVVFSAGIWLMKTSKVEIHWHVNVFGEPRSITLSINLRAKTRVTPVCQVIMYCPLICTCLHLFIFVLYWRVTFWPTCTQLYINNAYRVFFFYWHRFVNRLPKVSKDEAWKWRLGRMGRCWLRQTKGEMMSHAARLNSRQDKKDLCSIIGVLLKMMSTSKVTCGFSSL